MKSLNVTLLYDALEDEERNDTESTSIHISDQLEKTLTALGHTVSRLPAEHDIRKLASRIEKDESDVIFNLCESLGGISQYEQNVAALLEVLGKRFTGAGSLGLSLAQDKALSKKIFHFHNIRYPKFSVMDAGHVEWSDSLD